MFAKFATAKNHEMLNPLKVSSNRCICLKTLNMCKIVLKFIPQLGFKLSTIQLQLRFQVQHSMTEL